MMTQKNSNMINMNPSNIIINFLVKSFGLKTYEEIQDTFNQVDVSTDEDFQKKFNGFYKVRRDDNWRKYYYDLFEKVKKDPNKQTFEYILKSIYQGTGKFEPSFSSKMLATLNPDHTIWDQYVLKNTGIKAPSKKGKDINSYVNSLVDTYKDIEDWYTAYLKTPNGKNCIMVFDKKFPNYNKINDVKKIDFLLWAKR